MQRRLFITAAVSAGWASVAAAAPAVTETQASSGIRAALERGAVAAVGVLGRTDGFLGNPSVRIPLPGVLEDAARLLRRLGFQRQLDELVVALNRAAEAAVPQARTLLVAAVHSMSVEDALQILSGGEDAATRFFEAKTREPLGERFLPIVVKATERVSLVDKYNAVASKAASFGLLKRDEANVHEYVTTKALDGLFFMIAEEERKIRRDPIGTGSAILRRVFGAFTDRR